MSLILNLHTTPKVPVEAPVINPDKLMGLKISEIAQLPVHYGNRLATLADFFSVANYDEADSEGEVRLVGDLSRFKHIGRAMTQGRLYLKGAVGMHLGAAMQGGEIVVEGDVDDWAGAEMSGGRITVQGNAAHHLGSAYPGSSQGMQGGEIMITGNAGHQTGDRMRRGLIAIGGDSGDFAGVNMLAGTLIIFGQPGQHLGAYMKRGSIVAMQSVDLLPTFRYACTYRPTFLRLYLRRLRELGMPISLQQFEGHYARWSGDELSLNRGEILLFNPNANVAAP